jgi:Acyl-CoA synthetase (NDP forming)
MMRPHPMFATGRMRDEGEVHGLVLGTRSLHLSHGGGAILLFDWFSTRFFAVLRRLVQRLTLFPARSADLMRLTDIDQLFTPGAVAVFGASDNADSIGGRVFRNLLAGGYRGQCYAINPKYTEVAGQPCYSDLNALDKQIDLALIATPGECVPGDPRSVRSLWRQGRGGCTRPGFGERG